MVSGISFIRHALAVMRPHAPHAPKDEVKIVPKDEVKIAERPRRRKLSDERNAITHKFDIAGHEGYIIVGLYEDATPGEVFLVMAKEGSTISGFVDAFAQAVSAALQYGVPLRVLSRKFRHMRFEPAGLTKHPDIQTATSIVDYVFHWLDLKFAHAPTSVDRRVMLSTIDANADAAPPCVTCGALMLRHGTRHTCPSCNEIAAAER